MCHGFVVFCQIHGLFDVGLMQNPVDHETVSIACHVGLHVGFSTIQTPFVQRPSSSGVK
jgi:hypothetical protein